MIHPSETDRRTDGRAIAYTRYSIYAVARKNINLTVRSPQNPELHELVVAWLNGSSMLVSINVVIPTFDPVITGMDNHMRVHKTPWYVASHMDVKCIFLAA